MAGVDVISTVNMFAIDGQSHSREELEDPLENDKKRHIARFGGTLVGIIRLRQHRHVHSDSAVVVMNAHK